MRLAMTNKPDFANPVANPSKSQKNGLSSNPEVIQRDGIS